MSGKTKIEWTEMSWNPTTGCTKISPGCLNCYAESFSYRLKRMGNFKYRNGFKVTIHENTLLEPYKWKKPSMVFVNSMSDLFHKNIPIRFIKKVFQVMNDCSHIQFQVLTKRADRLLRLNNKLTWSPNIWMGVSVESQEYTERIDELRKTDAFIKFISFEPLIDCVSKVSLKGIDWVIVGGESGPKSRPMKKEWVIKIRNNCKKHDVPFFFKQWGGFNKHKNGRELDGRFYNDYPEIEKITEIERVM